MTTSTATIAEWLLERIAEDEAVALAATHQKAAGPSHGNWNADSVMLTSGGLIERADRLHIARHDPSRVLATCKVHRAIVESYQSFAAVRSDDELATRLTASGATAGLDFALRALASIYRDAPGFREEWAG